jgi:hypothetical protein
MSNTVFMCVRQQMDCIMNMHMVYKKLSAQPSAIACRLFPCVPYFLTDKFLVTAHIMCDHPEFSQLHNLNSKTASHERTNVTNKLEE